MSSQFIIQYQDTILNPTLFLLDVVGRWTDKSFNIEYCSHHPKSRGKYMQCPGLHNTRPIHMWLLFCCMYHTILKMIITGIWRFQWLNTMPTVACNLTRLLMWWHFIRQARIYWVLGNKDVWISVVRLFKN